MAKSNKTYRYSVELNIHGIEATSVRFANKNDIYINICLLGVHRRTHLLRPNLPLCIEQKLYFDKTFQSCHDPCDIIQRLEREHVLIELLQAHVPTPILLASYETSAKDFLYPHSYQLVQYTGTKRTALLNRTIDFPGVSLCLDFTVNPSFQDVTGIKKAIKNLPSKKRIHSRGKSPKRSSSPSYRPSTACNKRPTGRAGSAIVSSSLTSHTISSALKNNYALRDTQEKLRELAIPGEVKYVVPIDKTAGREPFVVRHVKTDLIGRTPTCHVTLNEGIVVNDYSLSRMNSPTSFYSTNDCHGRSRSISPANNRNRSSSKPRNRSRSTSQHRARSCKSTDINQRKHARTPERRSNSRSPARLCGNCSCYDANTAFHSTNECDICQLYRNHSERSRRAKSLEKQQFLTSSKHHLYAPDTYTYRATRPITSATLTRDPFYYRHEKSPANELSDRVIDTLRRNINAYNTQPFHSCYSHCHYSNDHTEDDELLERSRRLTQD